MTSFQIVALITPALIGLVLLATAAFVRCQNKAPTFGSVGQADADSVVTPEFALRPADNIRPTSRSETYDMELALAAVRERMAVSPQILADVSVEIGVLSDDIHRKLDRMTELVQSKAQAR